MNNSLKLLFIALSTIFVSCCGQNSCNSNSSSSENMTLKTIHERKSVRSYTDKQVSREQLITLIKAGMAAPTGKDVRPWEFMIIDNRETLDKLADALPYAKMLKNAPSAIIVCGNMDVDNGGSFYWYLDCAASTQNILLAAESMGLGAVWTTAYPYEDRMESASKILELPSNIGVLAIIPVGYPTGKEKPKDKYNADKIHINKW